jgi:CheY-like chemotaxis protein
MLLMHDELPKTSQEVTDSELQRWDNSFQKEVFDSLRSEIIWKLPLLYLLFAVLIGFIMSYQREIGRQQALFVMLGISAILVLQLFFTKVKSTKKLFDILYLICGITSIVPFGFLVSWQYNYFFLLLAFFTQALCWMIFPWSLSKSMCWAIFLLSYWGIILNIKAVSIFSCLPLFPIMMLAVCIPRLRFQEINLYQANLFLTKLCTNTQNSLLLCLQLCRFILHALDLKKGVLIMPDGRIYRINNNSCLLLNYSPLTAISVYTSLNDRHESQGYWLADKDNIPLKAFIYDCLESKTRQFRYYFLRTVEKNRECEPLYLIPNLSFFDTLSFVKMKSGIKSLLEIYNISLFTLHNQNMSNDTVLAYGTALADREEDINQLVHTVNNKAQEISIHCDLIKQQLSAVEDSLPEGYKLISSEALNIEDNIRLLTQNVSDIKLIREIAALRSLPRIENAALKDITSDLRFFAEKIVLTKNCTLVFDNNLTAETDGVSVPSVQYLETVLRVLLRLSAGRVTKTSTVSLAVTKKENEIWIEIADNGRLGLDEPELKAIFSFAGFSGGRFEVLKNQAPYTNFARLVLPFCEMKGERRASSGHWILLVDDNEQLINFYSRIAEALGMQYKTANSYEQAVSILELYGKPRIAITDIQLSNSSGLDVVTYLRKKYEQSLPVIVVSGNDDLDIAKKAYQAGATKYLKKPLGKKKLFSEIEGLI